MKESLRTDAIKPDCGCRRDVACYVFAGALRGVRALELFGSFVAACRAARLAIEESVIAKAHVNHGLAQTAILLTLAIPFALLALRAAIFGGPGSGAHDSTVSLVHEGRKRDIGNKRRGQRSEIREDEVPSSRAIAIRRHFVEATSRTAVSSAH